MKASILFTATAAALTATPAFAEWMLDNGVAIVSPVSNNSTMELLAVSCGDPYMVEVFSRGGPVQPDPAAEGAPADYFYQPGKVEARIDGRAFPLTAAASGAAVVLFSRGTAAQNHMAPIDTAFVDALKDGIMLTLAFDVTPDANAVDGSPYETMADFPLEGSRAVLDEALTGCD